MMKYLEFSVTASRASEFRSDINTLRALAVAVVVLYHFDIGGFSGGFVGVDIFFVISGFLLTGIVTRQLESGKFSIFDFYSSRIIRIIPALVVLCGSLLVLGWALLAPDDYSTLAIHVRDTLLFVSNNTYRKESGYFDADSHEKWLLHTWSLSVEWQFYLLLPVILSVVWKIRSRRTFLFFCIVTLATVSFYSCIGKVNDAPTKAFYILKYRCWEMLIGGALFFLVDWFRLPEWISKICFYAGLLLLFLSITVINSGTIWPGWYTIPPVLAACLLILSNTNNYFFCNFYPAQWAGSRSYSIYLWHWPVVVLLAYYQKLNNGLWLASGLMLSLLLGEISFRYVEKPLNKKFGSNRYIYPVTIVGLAAGICAISYYLIYAKGMPSRVAAEVASISAEKNNRAKSGHSCIYDADKEKGPLSCVYGEGQAAAIVLGDSHASAIVTAVHAAMRNSSASVYLWSRAACPVIKGVTAKIDQDCDGFVSWVEKSLDAIPADVPIVIIERWSIYAFGANEGVVGDGKIKPPVFFDQPYDLPSPEFLTQFSDKSISTICRIANDRKVYLVKPVPEMRINVPQVLARWKMTGVDKRIFISMEEYNIRHQFILDMMGEARKRCSVEILDPLPYLCERDMCFGDKNGKPIYFDDDHLSEYGNKFLVPMFERVFNHSR